MSLIKESEKEKVRLLTVLVNRYEETIEELLNELEDCKTKVDKKRINHILKKYK